MHKTETWPQAILRLTGRQRRRDARTLHALNDRDLADIGLRRETLHHCSGALMPL